MTLHLRPLPPKQRKRCDTRALLEARARVRRELENEIAERDTDSKLPRHFSARQQYRQTGEIPDRPPPNN